MSKLENYWEEIRDKYINNKQSLMSLAKEYNCDRQTIRRLLIEHNIQIRDTKQQNSVDIPEEIQKQVIYNYTVLKKGLISSGKPFNLSQRLVKKILQNNDIYIRNYIESKDNLRKYTINDNYFKVQSHNMAYILGLIAADGNISSKENGVSISLKETDKEILEKINEELNNSRPIKVYERTDRNEKVAKLLFWSSTIKKDLSHYGLKPNKTFNIEPPHFLLPEYRISYIRGYFDGDGSISLCKHTPQFRISGASKEIISWIKDCFSIQYNIYTNLRIEREKLSQDRDWYILDYYGDRAKQIYNILYIKDSLCMKRKYQKFSSIMNNYPRD